MSGERLPREHRRALDVTLSHFGGTIYRVPDLFVASISKSVMHDLEDLGLVRRYLLGWEITLAGRKALRDD